MLGYLTRTPDQEGPPTGPPAARPWVGWAFSFSSFVLMLGAVAAAFVPWTVDNGPGGTVKCTRPLMLAFVRDETGLCQWSTTHSRCTLILVLAVVAVVLVAVAVIRFGQMSLQNVRFTVGL